MKPLLTLLNAPLAFALELAMLAAFGWWGYHASGQVLFRWLLAIGLPLAVATVWGLFAAPRAASRLSGPWLFLLELGLMLAAAALLWRGGQRNAALLLAALAVVSQVTALYTAP